MQPQTQARRRPIASPLDAEPPAPPPKSQTDASYITIGLPSDFQWYGFKQLSIRPLRVPEIKKIHSAHITDDIRMFYEAMAPCIDQDIMNLTIGDAYAVMYWLRINSYPKTPYTIRFKCMDVNHINRTLHDPQPGDSWKRKPLESLKNSYDLTATIIEEVKMKPVADIRDELLSMDLVKAGVAFAPARVRDLIEVGEFVNEPWFDEGADFLCRLASYLDYRHGESLRERYDFIVEHPEIFTPDDIMVLDRVADLLTHGVRETVQLPCKDCGASNTVVVPVDARTFLPYLYRD